MTLTKLLAITLVVVLGFGITTLTTTAYADNDKQDKCVSQSEEDGAGTFCSTNDETQEVIEDVKDTCKENAKENDRKCSSSQTGHGAFGNFCKQGETELAGGC